MESQLYALIYTIYTGNFNICSIFRGPETNPPRIPRNNLSLVGVKSYMGILTVWGSAPLTPALFKVKCSFISIFYFVSSSHDFFQI